MGKSVRCAQCAKEFFRYRVAKHDRMFCSKPCSSRWFKPAIDDEVPCRGCGQRFSRRGALEGRQGSRGGYCYCGPCRAARRPEPLTIPWRLREFYRRYNEQTFTADSVMELLGFTRNMATRSLCRATAIGDLTRVATGEYVWRKRHAAR